MNCAHYTCGRCEVKKILHINYVQNDCNWKLKAIVRIECEGVDNAIKYEVI